MSVSPDEKYFAFATVKGVVCILEQSQSLKFRRVQTSAEHHGSEVTALQWNACRSELFVGDDSGRISVISSSAFVVRTRQRNVTYLMFIRLILCCLFPSNQMSTRFNNGFIQVFYFN